MGSNHEQQAPRRRPITALGAVVIALLLPASPVLAQNAPTAKPADGESLEAIVRALYETVNRRPGEHFAWDRLRTLLLPSAILIPAVEQTGGEFRVLSVEDFIAWVDRHTVIGGQADKGFREEEIARRIERYGDIAQIFSTYQKRFWDSTEILGRGINAINLVNKDGRWWIASILWDEEAGAGPLPARYVTGKSQ